MDHIMYLNAGPFEKISSRKKSIEIRCNDEKRKKIRVGDTITFIRLPGRDGSLRVRVTALYPFRTFCALFSRFDFSEFGCEGYTMERMLKETRSIYSEEKERAFGVLGIRVEPIA